MRPSKASSPVRAVLHRPKLQMSGTEVWYGSKTLRKRNDSGSSHPLPKVPVPMVGVDDAADAIDDDDVDDNNDVKKSARVPAADAVEIIKLLMSMLVND